MILTHVRRARVLVDLANSSVYRGVHRPNRFLVGSRLDELIRNVAIRVHGFLGSVPCELRFRLYDGWFDARGHETEIHGMVASHVRDNYPTRRREYRLLVEVADRLLAAREDRIVDSVRQTKGLGKHRVTVGVASACVMPAACSIAHLTAWVRGSCSVVECPVMTEDIATYRQQKLVDTAIVADTVWIGSQREPVVVVSDDEDVIPGLIVARSYGVTVGWACRSGRARDPYTLLFAKHGIECLTC